MDIPMMHPEGAPGAMQSLMGDAAFKQMMEGNEAYLKILQDAAAATQHRYRVVTAVMLIGSAMLLSALLPVLVLLWRIAL